MPKALLGFKRSDKIWTYCIQYGHTQFVMAHQLSEKAMLILASVADGERHGYAISRDVVRRTGGEVRLGSATLYRLLSQLFEDGLVEESDRRPAPELDDERRRYYRITTTGRRALAAELGRLDRVLAAARIGRRSASQRA